MVTPLARSPFSNGNVRLVVKEKGAWGGTIFYEDSIPPTTQVFLNSMDWLKELRHLDVDIFSADVFGVEYKEIKGILYPKPPYKTFLISKRSGGHRVIREPRRRLKGLQEKLLLYLYACAELPKPCVHAFTKNRSIVTNARKHLEHRPHFVLNIDLEDFFPSINFYRVRGVLQRSPFNFARNVASMLAHMCVVENELPQGAPTSPILSNQVCRSMDRDLMALARRHQATYTRYADDLTFSFSTPNPTALPANICTFQGGMVVLGEELTSIIRHHNFRINQTKTRMSTRRRRMEVTGVVINSFPNVKRVFIDGIRGGLHAWQIYGYNAAQVGWENRVSNTAGLGDEKNLWKRQTRVGKIPELKNVLWGRLLFVRMVRGAVDPIYTRLAERYNSLVRNEKEKNHAFKAPLLPIEPIVTNSDDVARAVFVIEWLEDYRFPGSPDTICVGAQSTAFAYRRRDRLITCDHALVGFHEFEGVSRAVDIKDVPGASLTAIDPATGWQGRLRVLHRDADRDLAILELVDDPPRLRFFSGAEAPISVHSPGRLIGFPNWTPGRTVNMDPAIVTNRLPRAGLKRVEINQLIRKGNSGGPFVDEQYRVVGVAQQGATQESGNNECLCVAELDKWIASVDS